MVNIKIKQKLFFNIILPLIIVLFVTSYYVVVEIKKKQRELLLEKIEVDNHNIKEINTKPLWNYDINSLKINSKIFLEKPEVVRITIRENNTKIVEVKDEKYPADLFYNMVVTRNGEKLGDIEVAYTSKYIDDEISVIMKEIYFVEVLLIVVIAVILLGVTKTIYDPILEIVKALKNIDEGNYNFRLYLKRNDEFKLIEKYFNKVISGFNEEKEKNRKNMKEITTTKDELEAAYNQMISINGILETTLSELEISGAKYRNIFKFSPAGIIILNLETNEVEETNEKMYEIFSEYPNDSEKSLIDMFFQNREIKFLMSLMKETWKPQKKLINFTNVRKSFMVTATPIESDKKYVQIFINDVTELKKMEIKLQNYAENLADEVKIRTNDLERANEKIKNQQKKMVENAYNRAFVEVTSGIIHNIGNIVNIINLSLDELIYDYPETGNNGFRFIKEVLKDELGKIENRSPRLNKIMKVLPEVADTMESFEKRVKENIIFISNKTLHLKEIVQLQQTFVGSLGTEDYNDINSIIKEALDIYLPSITKRNIRIKFDNNEEYEVLCDKGQIFQVITNLIKNSYEAIEESNKKNGLIEIKTWVNNSNSNSNTYISIWDNGTGIKEENLENLFEFGFSTKKSEGRGSGYGLHSCKSIIEKYSGTISVKSNFNEYTEFLIMLPKRSTN